MAKDRHSEPDEPPEQTQLTEKQRAPREAANGLRQFDRLIALLDQHLQDLSGDKKKYFHLRPSHLMELNRLAVDGLVGSPGAYRQVPMKISRSTHVPPAWEDVPKYIDEMCQYINDNWHKSAIHLAAYALWRLNWIHPFLDGNGRTARAISYLVLCVRLQQRLPGSKTLPDLISDDKGPYYQLLEIADRHDSRGKINVAALEKYLSRMLNTQVSAAAEAQRKSARPEKRDSRPKDVARIEAALSPKKTGSKAIIIGATIGAVGVIAAAIIAALAATGPGATCVPNKTVSCACIGEQLGTQTCLADGERFSECSCHSDIDLTTAPARDATGDRGPP